MSTSIAASNVHALARTATDTRTAEHVWHAEQDLAETRNAHRSNTEGEMRDALEGDHNWLEGDLRVDDDGGLVMAHDAKAEGDGLSLDQWLEVGAAGERGLKVDVKEADAVPALVDKLAASGIPSERLMVNVGVSTSVEDVRAIRTRLPDAWIAITPPEAKGGYSPEDLQQAIDRGKAAGGNVSYPIRWDLASDATIQTLKRNGEGRVSIWTNQAEGTPDDTAGETRRLRERGVDGVIDLGPPQSTLEKAQMHGKDALGAARDGVDAILGRHAPISGRAGNLLGD